MNKHRKGLYIIAGLFYLFFSGALALYPTKMTVGATVSMIAGAVLTLIAAIASFVLAAQCKNNAKASAVRNRLMPICFIGFAAILAADLINTAVHFESLFDAVRITAELICAAGHIAVAVVMLKNNMALVRRKGSLCRACRDDGKSRVHFRLRRVRAGAGGRRMQKASQGGSC